MQDDVTQFANQAIPLAQLLTAHIHSISNSYFLNCSFIIRVPYYTSNTKELKYRDDTQQYGAPIKKILIKNTPNR